MKTRAAQASIEYITLIGVALMILAVFLFIAMYMYSSFNNSANYNQLSEMSNGIVNTVDELSSQSVGSTYSLSFFSPGLASPSFFCGDILVLNSKTGHEVSTTSNMNMSGILPLNGGQFQAYVSILKTSNGAVAMLSLDLPISKIISDYSLSPGSISYNITFLNASNSAVPTNFNLTALYMNGTQIFSLPKSANSGNIAGSSSLPSSVNSVIMVVYVPTYSEESAQCVPP
ncbi:MAG: hypothetical protein QXJ12_00225 [Candidatus Parvarchaeota archaeon]|nr:hypothetical protein [Candidatus Parvarchaeota archaeon]